VGRKRAHELQTHRLVSSGTGASAVSTNTSRAPTEPAAGISAEQDRLRPARSPQDRQGSRERRRPLRWPQAGLGESAPCGMRSVQTFDTGLQLCRREPYLFSFEGLQRYCLIFSPHLRVTVHHSP